MTKEDAEKFRPYLVVVNEARIVWLAVNDEFGLKVRQSSVIPAELSRRFLMAERAYYKSCETLVGVVAQAVTQAKA